MVVPIIIAILIIVEVAGIGTTIYSIYDSHQVQEAIINSNNEVMDAIANLPPQMEVIYYNFNYGIDFWSMIMECWVQIWLIATLLIVAYIIINPKRKAAPYPMMEPPMYGGY